MATDLTEGKLQAGRGQKAQLSAYKIRSKEWNILMITRNYEGLHILRIVETKLCSLKT